MSTTSLPKRKRLFSRLREKISIPCIGSSEAHHSPPSPTPSGESINQHPYGGIGQRIPSPNLRFSKSFHSRPPSPLPDSKYAVEPLEVHLGDKLDVGYGNLKDSDGRNLSLATTSGGSGSQTGGYGDVKKVEEPEELEPISNIHPQEAEVQVSSQPPLPAVAIQDVDSNAPAVAEEIKTQDQEKREDTEDTVMAHGRKEAPELTVGAMLTISPPTSPPPPPAINTLSPLTPTPAISLQPPSPASPHASSSPITFDSPTSDDVGFAIFKGKKEDLRKEIVRKKSLNNGNSANAPPPEVLTFDSPTEEREDAFAALKGSGGPGMQKKMDRRELMKINMEKRRPNLGRLSMATSNDDNGQAGNEVLSAEPEDQVTTFASPVEESSDFRQFASPIEAPDGYQLFGGAPGGLAVDGQVDEDVTMFASPSDEPEGGFSMFKDPLPMNGGSGSGSGSGSVGGKLDPIRTSTIDLQTKKARSPRNHTRNNPSIAVSDHDDLLTPHTNDDDVEMLMGGRNLSASPIAFHPARMRSRSDASSNGDVEEEEATPLPDRSKDRTFSTASSAGSSVFSQSKLDVPSPITPVSNDGRIGLHHRRKSSSHSVKETHNAITTSNPDGSRTLNQYKFGRKLGKGSFGSVELVVDTNTGVEYAVKEFSKSTLKKRAKAEMLRGKGRRNQFLKVLDQFDNDPMQLIKGEVAVMKKLDHKHIAKLFEVLDSTGDSLFMVIELCPGGSLMRLEIGEPSPPLSEADARHYFRQIVLGLEYLHYNDIAHRDIKPDNILLMNDVERTCKIVDFGVSEVFDKRGDDSGSKNAGSPAFLPPESCGAPSPAGLGGFPADVWAAGVTLYALLIGRLPFESTLPMELYSLICSQEPEYPNTLSESAVDLLKTLLEKDPVKRAKIDDIRDHAWLTKDGTDPLISKEENVTYEPIAIEVEDLKTAFQPRVPFTVLKAVGKFRRLTSERRSLSATEVQRDMMSQSNNSSDTVPRPPAFSQLSTPSPERKDTLSVEDAERIIATSPDRFVPQSPDRFVVQSPVTEIPLSSSIPAHDHNN